MPKNDFESTHFENFEELTHNFGRSDDFQYVQTRFDAQLDQKNLGWYLLYNYG